MSPAKKLYFSKHLLRQLKDGCLKVSFWINFVFYWWTFFAIILIFFHTCEMMTLNSLVCSLSYTFLPTSWPWCFIPCTLSPGGDLGGDLYTLVLTLYVLPPSLMLFCELFCWYYICNLFLIVQWCRLYWLWKQLTFVYVLMVSFPLTMFFFLVGYTHISDAWIGYSN